MRSKSVDLEQDLPLPPPSPSPPPPPPPSPQPPPPFALPYYPVIEDEAPPSLPLLALSTQHVHAEQPTIAQRFGTEIVVGCLLGVAGALTVVLYMARRHESYSAIKRDEAVDDEADGMLVPIDRVLDDDLIEHHLQPIGDDDSRHDRL